MATRRQVNNPYQVKTINGQRWVCLEVPFVGTVQNGTWDFVSESDGRAWKKIRLWKPGEIIDRSLAGQGFDDKGYTSRYVDDGYVQDDYAEKKII
jgi:hypothetical protein